jgi:cytochrome c oxidase subunit 2
MVNRLELAWTLGTVVLITGVAVYSTVLLYHIDTLPAHADEYVTVTGHQWYWEFCYTNGTCANSIYDPNTGAISGGALWAAPGSVIQLNITSVDVIHSFNIPNLGIRLDAIPGRTNSIAFSVPSAPAGTQYLIQCTEFCGTYHGIMRSYLVIT